MSNEKEELITAISEVLGHIPPDTRRFLQTLAHPDVIGYTNRYFGNLDPSTRCTKYEAPWSCAREAEAKYMNIKFGWTGGAGGIGLDDSWCANCQKKVLDG